MSAPQRERADQLTVRVEQGGVAAIEQLQWDQVVGDQHPFLSHAFLSVLERSGSVGEGTGWQAAPLLAEDSGGAVRGALPAYIKGHSQGEYVFDHSWADAWHRAGGRYYPKLQIAVPFTPAQGPRVLAADETAGLALLKGAEALVEQNGLSSAHATFVDLAQVPLFEKAGWMLREGIQYHWFNRGYESFDEFLGSLSSRKRRTIRKERAGAQEGLTIRHLVGTEIEPRHWDAFWRFYQDTGARKWGQPYLTRSFFPMVGEALGDKVLLILAERDGVPIAGALNFIGREALYGRYWGCSEDVPFLHFELCYYQAIDAAITRGLSRVEAGAQGEHKLARGYEPMATWSAHFIPHPGFKEAVSDFLIRERRAVERDIAYLGELTPFKKDG
jgi:uncharacterized protein